MHLFHTFWEIPFLVGRAVTSLLLYQCQPSQSMLSYKRLFACWWSTSLCFSFYVSDKKGISCLAAVFHVFPYSWIIPLHSAQFFLDSKPSLKCWCHHCWEQGSLTIFCRRLPTKPLLKIRTTNAVCWNHLGLSRDYGLNHIFLE